MYFLDELGNFKQKRIYTSKCNFFYILQQRTLCVFSPMRTLNLLNRNLISFVLDYYQKTFYSAMCIQKKGPGTFFDCTNFLPTLNYHTLEQIVTTQVGTYSVTIQLIFLLLFLVFYLGRVINTVDSFFIDTAPLLLM